MKAMYETELAVDAISEVPEERGCTRALAEAGPIRQPVFDPGRLLDLV